MDYFKTFKNPAVNNLSNLLVSCLVDNNNILVDLDNIYTKQKTDSIVSFNKYLSEIIKTNPVHYLLQGGYKSKSLKNKNNKTKRYLDTKLKTTKKRKKTKTNF